MTTLSEKNRRLLERTVRDAREAAEAGARAALRQKTVDAPEPGPHLDNAGRTQRNKLRAHARALGDALASNSAQSIDRLAAECAYAHWHRMLFARFLAENGLLLKPDDGMPIALDELDEWAVEWKLKSRWAAAEHCAAKLLPQIFGASELVLSVALPPDRQATLEALLDALPREVFTARDALGWVYQFWQAAEKERVNKAETKIGADELPAVTQLFTEPYMVDFLLQNTLGAWWVGRHGVGSLPVEMPYLRLLEDGTPAAGTFEQWPQTAKEITVLDPCCGSGHFLVAAFDMLVKFRMAEEKLCPLAAATGVLQDNLHGLELDPRCTQIAAFAVAFSAWTLVGKWFELPELQIACVGLGVRAPLDAWLALANGNSKFRAGMERLYTQFRNAPVLGSLIDPTATRDPLLEASFEELRPLLTDALRQEKWADDVDAHEYGTAAQGIARAAMLLSRKYKLVCTNPPYLTRSRSSSILCEHLDDIAERGVDVSSALFYEWGRRQRSETRAFVLPSGWLFLSSHYRHRKWVFERGGLRCIVMLGTRAFRSISGEVVNVALAVSDHSGDGNFFCISAQGGDDKEKASALCSEPIVRCDSKVQLSHPKATFTSSDTGPPRWLKDFASSSHGQGTFDTNRFTTFFWEVSQFNDVWVRQQSGVEQTTFHGGCCYALRWEHGCGSLAALMDAKRDAGYTTGKWRAGVEMWGRQGVLVGQMGRLPATIYAGYSFDENASVLSPKTASNLAALWAFIESGEYTKAVREIDSSIKVTTGTLVKVPFDLERWQKVAAEKYPDGLPAPHSDDPTQWLFRGDITTSTRPLQVAVARLVGYRWPDQPDDAALDAHADGDGVVCLPAVRNEDPADDRLRRLLAAAYGDRWSPTLEDDLLTREGAKGMTLKGWLRDGFFAAHCQLFEQRPFVWQVWDGLPDGFSALLHYQRLTRALLDTLINVDLGDWIDRQESGGKGAAERLAAARTLKNKLQKIAEGEAPYDIFVRWKALDAQPLGWAPDLDDGVRANIRPFLEADVLRTPAKTLAEKILKATDRGKDPSTAPWFAAFGGVRRNDHHTTLKQKAEARAEKARREAEAKAKRDAGKKKGQDT